MAGEPDHTLTMGTPALAACFAKLTLGANGAYTKATFIYDNTAASGPTAQTMGALTAWDGDQTVQVTRTATQDVFLTFTTYGSGQTEDGRTINFVVNGPGVINGTNAKVVLSDQTAYRITKPNAAYFNGSDFAVYDAGPDASYATPADGSVRGIISGAGSMTVNAGMLTLSADNTYTGATTISGGTLQIGNGGTTGSLSTSGAITNDGTLIFNRAGSLTLTGINAYTGNTTVKQGALVTGTISGSGSTELYANTQLTATSIVQNTLTIGAGSSVTIKETTGTGSASPVPEPGTWLLIGIAFVGWLALRRRR